MTAPHTTVPHETTDGPDATADPAAARPLSVAVRYFAAARAAAGVEGEEVTLDEPATLGDLRAELARRHDRLEPVLTRCSFLINEITETDPEFAVTQGARVDVLPPFAGG